MGWWLDVQTSILTWWPLSQVAKPFKFKTLAHYSQLKAQALTCPLVLELNVHFQISNPWSLESQRCYACTMQCPLPHHQFVCFIVVVCAFAMSIHDLHCSSLLVQTLVCSLLNSKSLKVQYALVKLGVHYPSFMHVKLLILIWWLFTIFN
jgi:hypothetical protein